MPTEISPTQPSDLAGRYAGFVTRAIAFCVDMVVVFLVVILVLGFAYLTGVMVGAGSAKLVSEHGLAVFAATAPVLFALYCSVAWTWAGETLGMALMGVGVVTTRGTRVGFPRALLRTVGYVVSTIFFFLGYLWVLVDPRRQAWHDKLARTMVVVVDRGEKSFLPGRLAGRRQRPESAT